jgi:ERCC4-type nuclease
MATSAIVTFDTNEIAHHPEYLNLRIDGCVQIAQRKLAAGDIEIMIIGGDTILIERKSKEDLLESIRDNRLSNQVLRMTQITNECYLLITDNLEVGTAGLGGYVVAGTGWNWGSIQGILRSVQQAGCCVMYDLDLAGAIGRIINYNRDARIIMPRKDARAATPQEAFLMGIPNIGIERAQLLLSHFGTPAMVLEWLTGNGEPAIAGIGNATRKAVNNFFGGKLTWKSLEENYE